MSFLLLYSLYVQSFSENVEFASDQNLQKIRNTVYDICEKQRCRPARTTAQSENKAVSNDSELAVNRITIMLLFLYIL